MVRSLTLRVITPDRIVLDETVESVRMPGVDGSLGVLPRHAHLVTALEAGLVVYEMPGGGRQELFVSGGFAEVRDDTVRVVTEASEPIGAIDIERAREAERRARERISAIRSGVSSEDLLRAEAALRRALLRLRLKGQG